MCLPAIPSTMSVTLSKQVCTYTKYSPSPVPTQRETYIPRSQPFTEFTIESRPHSTLVDENPGMAQHGYIAAVRRCWLVASARAPVPPAPLSATFTLRPQSQLSAATHVRRPTTSPATMFIHWSVSSIRHTLMNASLRYIVRFVVRCS